MKEKWRLKNRMKSFGYAIKGLKVLFIEPNLIIHLCATILAIITGLILKISATHWAIITLIIALVISLELINTAIEKLIDHLQQLNFIFSCQHSILIVLLLELGLHQVSALSQQKGVQTLDAVFKSTFSLYYRVKSLFIQLHLNHFFHSLVGIINNGWCGW